MQDYFVNNLTVFGTFNGQDLDFLADNYTISASGNIYALGWIVAGDTAPIDSYTKLEAIDDTNTPHWLRVINSNYGAASQAGVSIKAGGNELRLTSQTDNYVGLFPSGCLMQTDSKKGLFINSTHYDSSINLGVGNTALVSILASGVTIGDMSINQTGRISSISDIRLDAVAGDLVFSAAGAIEFDDPIVAGEWQATAIADAYISSASTWNAHVADMNNPHGVSTDDTGGMPSGIAQSHFDNTSNPHGVSKSQIGLSNVENTALSTWAGSSNISTLGTITTGTWQGSVIPSGYLDSNIAYIDQNESITGAWSITGSLAVDSLTLDGATIYRNTGSLAIFGYDVNNYFRADSGYLYTRAGAGFRTVTSSGAFYPYTDNSISLGGTINRWTGIYGVQAVIGESGVEYTQIVSSDIRGYRSSYYFGNAYNGGNLYLRQWDSGGTARNIMRLWYSSGGLAQIYGALTVDSTLTMGGDIAMASNNITALATLQSTAAANRCKLSVWTGTTYGIGMTSAMTYGYLGYGAGGAGEYAMTFQMDADADRGFWWGQSGHAAAQGAMSLTADGKLYVDDIVNVGGTWIIDSSNGVEYQGNYQQGLRYNGSNGMRFGWNSTNFLDVRNNAWYWYVGGVFRMAGSTTALYPYTDSAYALGSNTKYWSGVYTDAITMQDDGRITNTSDPSSTYIEFGDPEQISIGGIANFDFSSSGSISFLADDSMLFRSTNAAGVVEIDQDTNGYPLIEFTGGTASVHPTISDVGTVLTRVLVNTPQGQGVLYVYELP